MEKEEAGGISFLMRKIILWLICFAMILLLGSLFILFKEWKYPDVKQKIEDVTDTYEAKNYFYINIDDLNNISAPVYQQVNGTFIKIGIINDYTLKGGDMK